MKKLTKKTLAVLLSVIMAIPTLLVVPFTAQAAVEWTAVASSDFTNLGEVTSNGSIGEVPTYQDRGSAMEWSLYGWGGGVESTENGLYIPDGYMWLSGYNSGYVPISGASNWKIELTFRFRNITHYNEELQADVHETDGYHSDNSHCFMKMYTGTDTLTNPDNDLNDHCYFEQNANGQFLAGDYTYGRGGDYPENSLCTGSKRLGVEQDYRYVVEFNEGVVAAYVLDAQENQASFIADVDVAEAEGFINAITNNNADTITSIKFGDDNNTGYYKTLEYKNITFYTGESTGTPEDNLLEAIDNYENKMSGTIYTNMAAAYDAYVAANKAYDEYKYGGNYSLDLTTYASALKRATVAMKPWNYRGTTGVMKQFFDGDSASDPAAVYAQYGVGNILYSGDNSDTTYNGTNVNMHMIYADNTVLLNDGLATPAIPVMVRARKDTSKARYVYQLYPCVTNDNTSNSSDFKLGATGADGTSWFAHASDGSARTLDWTWNLTDTTDSTRVRVKADAGTVSNTSPRLTLTNNNNLAAMANVMSFIGGANAYTTDGDNTIYSKKYNVCWYHNSGNDPGDVTYYNDTHNIYVVNYKALLDVMNSNKTLLNIPDDTYTQGGLRDVIAAYDLATAVDAAGYDYTANNDIEGNVNAIGTQIGTAVKAFEDANTATDNTGYHNLAKAIEATTTTYYQGAEGYTDDSWTAFSDAFQAALADFSNVREDGYTDADAQTKADELNAAAAGLKTLIDRVDSTELEMAIREAQSAIANKAMFTNDSYSASDIENVVAAAKEAVWGAEGNYPNAKFKLVDNEENAAIVDDEYDNVAQAVFALEINTSKNVVSVSYVDEDSNEYTVDYSLVSAIAKAAEYDADDYGNYSVLSTAVNTANSFAVAVTPPLAENSIDEKIAEYKADVRAILNAISILKPSFNNISDGTIARFDKDDTTWVNSTEDGGPRWKFKFTRNNNFVIFRTENKALNVDLGGAQFEWYNSENGRDADLDSINIYDNADNTVGEIRANAASGWTYVIAGTADPVNIEDLVDDYKGQLAYTVNGANYKLSNITVSQGSSDQLGTSKDGVAITDTTYKFDSDLSSTEGSSTDDRLGTIKAKNGTTYFGSDFTLSLKRPYSSATVKLTESTLPTLAEYTIDSNIGIVYCWNYWPVGRNWVGYSHNRTAYTQTTKVINIVPLVQLINTAKTEQTNEMSYKKDAWSAFDTALTAANANMDYDTMEPEAVVEQCQTRYTNLWNAYNALPDNLAATNATVKAAVNDTDIRKAFTDGNKDGRWSPERWATFNAAYSAASNALKNIYSDDNVRDYGTDEQNTIDALAFELEEAYSNLVTYGGRADFTAIIEAANTYLEDNAYTAESLGAIATALADATQYPYLNMTDEEKAAVYNETANINAIAAEAEKIAGVFATTPVAASIDASTLEAAKVAAKAAIKDPDAYGNVDEIKALIDGAAYTENVTIFGDYTVSGVMYDSQEALNAAVQELLTGLTPMSYEVSVVNYEDDSAVEATFKDMDGNPISSKDGKASVPYGTRITVTAPETQEVDWFYSYNSNTVSQTASKYYTTDKWINVTIKGNTTLAIKSAQAETETVKITYVNAKTGNVYSIDYAEKGAQYTFTAAPVLAFYNFLGFTLEEDSDDYIDDFTPTEDTIVYANYDFDDEADTFTVTIANLNGSIDKTSAIEDLEYNDLIELQYGDGTNGIYNKKSTGKGYYYRNGEKGNLTTRYKETSIYAWVVVNEDNIDNWTDYRTDEYGTEYIQNVEKVVMYGDSYSFRVCENIYVIPYTEEQFTEAEENGYIFTGDSNKAAVRVQDKLVNETNGEKISMIGSYTLPSGDYELVEAGMLFKATTDGTVPEGDFTLANAGTNGIARMKSSHHTVGNQFVISVNTSKLSKVTITAKYIAYMIYADGEGNQYVVYSGDVVTDSTYID